jgi:hypothetical protein
MSTGFVLADDPIALPKGAWAATERRSLRRDGRTVFSITQGQHRAYLFPVYTPAGFAVTSECPADHPHHNSLWIASDHIRCWMPVAGGAVEEYTYNLYLDGTFQGRAAGRIIQTAAESTTDGSEAVQIVQSLDWRGPAEWAAPDGRLLAREKRVLEVRLEAGAYIIDVASVVTAANWDLTFGPTRHAYFSVRMAESIAVTGGGAVIDDRGKHGGEALTGVGPRWVDYSGPVGGGHVAGIAVCPHPEDHKDLAWFVSNWGVITVGPFRNTRRDLRVGESMQLRYRVIVHDGDAEQADIAGRLTPYLAG